MSESLIRNLIKRAFTTRDIVDKGQFMTSQAAWGSDKVGNIEVVYPWGLTGVPPVGSMALIFTPMGHEENRAAIVNDPRKRLRGLAPGEVALGNWLAKSYIRFWNNGDIQIKGSNNANITITKDMNVTVKGNVTVNVAGDSTINVTGNSDITSGGDMTATVGGDFSATIAGDAVIDAPLVRFTGELRVTGDVTVLYGTVNQITFSDMIIKYNEHTHVAQGAFATTTVPTPTLP